MSELLRIEVQVPELVVGVVRAGGVTPGPTPVALGEQLDRAIAAAQAAAEYPAAEVKLAVRDLLRHHGYKPAGRGKPASEFLAGAARQDAFPRIDTLVDINNLVSLRTGLPLSMLDLGGFETTPVLRTGRDDESYVFNPAGQEIALAGLLVVCDGDTPRGSAVKDSMATKVHADTHAVLVVVYGSQRVVDAAAMQGIVGELGDLLHTHATASELESAVLTAGTKG